MVRKLEPFFRTLIAKEEKFYILYQNIPLHRSTGRVDGRVLTESVISKRDDSTIIFFVLIIKDYFNFSDESILKIN